MKNPSFRNSPRKPFDLDLDDLLHPARAFAHPQEVVSDPDLTLNEKRAILVLRRFKWIGTSLPGARRSCRSWSRRL